MGSQSKEVRLEQKAYWEAKLARRIAELADKGRDPRAISADTVVRKLRAEVRDFRDDDVETYFEALELYLKGIYQLKLARDLVAKVEESGSPHYLKYESLKGAVEGPLKKARGCLCDSSLSGSMRRELEGRYGALHTTVVLYLHELERLADGKPRIYTLPSSLGRRKTEGVGLR